MQLPNEPESRLEINIVPMIDVIFSILAFFIISTLFLTRSEGLDVNLPKAATAQAQKSAEITVTIDEEGEISLNRKPLELQALQETIQQEIAPGTEPLVIVNADRSVDHGRVVEVMDRLRQLKGIKLAIAAER
ncbi:biopolymer transporter ExbD [Lusitaniella coriacea LEGE 07157]|uniref:Biopolymer transporter ExbD n=2 Tax=Lusitaniella TaxID=1983104 RepID=A0A8J7E1U0_9CYAN|nr:biopolymer transporter ExbD [Lusitaniella coriacea]MBE9118001.1 biopolymer transporter ExbD [Lusitaniella coriacea LEGE 07157]